MSKAHVEAVFGPQYVQDALAFERSQARSAERVIIALRRKLIDQDPSLPHYTDGNAWAEIERPFHLPSSDSSGYNPHAP